MMNFSFMLPKALVILHADDKLEMLSIRRLIISVHQLDIFNLIFFLILHIIKVSKTSAI